MPNPDLINLIQKAAVTGYFPDDAAYLSISHDAVYEISRQAHFNNREIEMAALKQNIIPERYARNMRAFSTNDQLELLQSSATVVGLGGLGGTVAELLARTGIGKLNLIDGDVFEESNLNRQLLSKPAVLGKSKAQTAYEHIGELNPAIELTCSTNYITPENCRFLLSDTDIVVDCLDNVKTRFLLEQSAMDMGIPLVFGAVGGHTGQVMTIFPEDRGLENIYGNQEVIPEKGIEATLGTLSPVVFMVASFQCAEVIKVVLKRSHILRNKLLVLDPFDLLFDVIDL